MREFIKNLFKPSDSKKQAINDRTIEYMCPSELDGVTAQLVIVNQGQPDQAQIGAQTAIEAKLMSSPQRLEPPSSTFKKNNSAQISAGLTDLHDQGQGGQGGRGRRGR